MTTRALCEVIMALALIGAAAGCGDDGPSGTESTTGETAGEQFCGLGGTGESGGVDGPWFELRHMGAPVEDGVTLTLICGGQGSWMFQLDPYFGGFTPDDDYIALAVEMNVDGHNVSAGHFFKRDAYSVFVGCEEPTYGAIGGGGTPDDIIAIIPPDELGGEVHTLNGLTGDLRVALVVGDTTIEHLAQVELVAPGPDDECYFY